MIGYKILLFNNHKIYPFIYDMYGRPTNSLEPTEMTEYICNKEYLSQCGPGFHAYSSYIDIQHISQGIGNAAVVEVILDDIIFKGYQKHNKRYEIIISNRMLIQKIMK